MPTGNGYSLGSDNSVVIIGGTGRIDLRIIIEFESKQMTKTTKVDPMQGPPLQDEVPMGWEMSFGFVRSGTALDDLFTTAEAVFYTTGILSNVTVFQYVTEQGGTQSCWQYDRVSLKLTEGGAWKGGEDVKMKVAGFASTKKRVS